MSSFSSGMIGFSSGLKATMGEIGLRGTVSVNSGRDHSILHGIRAGDIGSAGHGWYMWKSWGDRLARHRAICTIGRLPSQVHQWLQSRAANGPLGRFRWGKWWVIRINAFGSVQWNCRGDSRVGGIWD
jgi:hypothetical protein